MTGTSMQQRIIVNREMAGEVNSLKVSFILAESEYGLKETGLELGDLIAENTNLEVLLIKVVFDVVG